MELWVRSQDKENLAIVRSLIIEKKTKSKYFNIFGSGYFLGTYVTKERALEILNEIQNLLQPKIKYIQGEPTESIVDFGYQITQNVDMKIQEINRIIYEMPKE